MGRSPCGDKAGLKKGPWTPEEDQKLLAYIEEHGHGSWRSLPEKAGNRTFSSSSSSSLSSSISLFKLSSNFLQVYKDVERVADSDGLTT